MALLDSVKSKLILTMTLLVVSVILIISFFVINSQRSAAQQQSQNELLYLTELIAINALPPLLFSDNAAAEQILKGLEVRPDILSALIYNLEGDIFASFTRGDGVEPPKNLSILEAMQVNDSSILTSNDGIEAFMPMISEGEVVGLLYIYNDMALMRKSLSNFYKVFITTALFALLISIGIMFWLQRLLTVPLRELVDTIQQITEKKDYSKRAKLTTTSEFNNLANNFNLMITEVDNKGRLLEHINQDLERRVQARTNDLESALHLANEGNRAKAEFLALISHEIRTPLNGIVGFSDILRLKVHDKDVLKTIELLNDSAAALLALLNGVLDFSKLDANKVEMEHRPFELHSLMQSVVIANIPYAEKKGLKLELKINHSERGYFYGDIIRLRQILNNMITNAIKFTHEGHVTINVDSKLNNSDTLLNFHIIDSGVGIPASKKKEIFSAFTQADSSITREYGGTGLGLTICRQLIELMNGSYGLESEVGKGSDFWFTLPLTKVQESDALDDVPEYDHDLINKKFVGIVLLAEDNPVNQVVAREMIASFGVACDIVSDGEKVVHSARSAKYDLILMDYHMPKQDGLQATYQIRAEGQNKATPIITLTADIQSKVAKKFNLAGANGILLKPFNRLSLAECFMKWLQVDKDNAESAKKTFLTTNNKDDSSHFDPSVLDDIYALSETKGAEIVMETVEYYFQTSPVLIENINKSISSNDYKSLFNAAHSLKSSAANIGAIGLAEVAKELENSARMQKVSSAQDILNRLEHIFDVTEQALIKKMECF